jgi:predicted nucleic acid-binding protein
MNVFLDTTVLVAASAQHHPHYSRAFPVLQRVAAGHDRGFISTHSIAETFAALTRLPVEPRVQPTEAAQIITDNLLPHFECVPVDQKDYLDAMSTMTKGGWTGAKIYDALLLRCAAKCGVDRI